MDSFYAQWRQQSGAVARCHEDRESPPEYLVQSIWQHQRLVRDELRTVDGETVKVLHPGFLNREGGPDFREAVVQFGDAPPCSGDVEVDIHANGWHAHGHDRNSAFATVILHVLWQNAPPKAEARTGPRMLVIQDKLDAPVGELSLWLSSDAGDLFPETLRGQCCSPLRELSAEKRSALLREAAHVRFRAKASQLQARARQAGWEQALWEGLFRALGYKHNSWPMQCLAERRDRWSSPRISPFELQARLFGISGLLPADLTRAQRSADGYLRRVWDQWWREREEFEECAVPRSLWRFNGQRPANHPQRRLALAAQWLASGKLPDKLEQWCSAEQPERMSPQALLETLRPDPDEFWSWHWTIRSPRLKRSQPLLGAGRVTDLAVNVILPWLWVRAAEGRNAGLQSLIEERFNTWPAAEDNSILRLARQRLLGVDSRRAVLSGAAEQQGLIQIVRDFCDHSNSVCDKCRFPELVKEWNGPAVQTESRTPAARSGDSVNGG